MNALRKLLGAWRMIGPANIARALVYARMKAAQERADPGSPGPVDWEPTGRLQEVKADSGGASYHYQTRELRVRAPWPEVIELDWGPPGVRPAPPFQTGPGADFQASLQAFRTSEVELRFHLDALELLAGDRTLRFESLPWFRGPESLHRARLAPGESIHGLGERAAPFDLRGDDYTMWNTDRQATYGPGADPLYACLPVYLSHPPGGPGCLVLYDNWARAEFDAGKSDPDAFLHHFHAGPLRYYLIAGPAGRALARLLDLTGRPPLPPLWALGFHQSRWSYPDQETVQGLAREFEAHGLPLSGIHLDIDFLDGYRPFTVNRRAFPDLPRLCTDLAERGLKIVTITGPALKRDPGYQPYTEGVDLEAFVNDHAGRTLHAPVWAGWAAFPDFTREDVRKWWGGLYRDQVAAGVAGFWHDLNEPQAFVGSGDGTLPANSRHLRHRHEEVHNLYAVLMNQAGFEGLRRARPEARPFILSRSGWIGVQAHAWLWTGDVESSWPALGQSLRTLLGLAVSGVPFTGSDTGGFSGHPQPELYLRWLQLSSLTPFFRVHSTRGSPRREPWSYGEPWLSWARSTIAFRYCLLPYLYTLAWEAATTGLPPIRPLLTVDPGLARAGDAFLLGGALIAAPALEPGVRERAVPLPPGRWHDYWSGEAFEGPGEVKLAASFDRVPLLARAGAVIPLAQGGLLDREPCDLVLRAFPPEGPETRVSQLYSDAGDGYGPARVDRFVSSRSRDRHRLEWSATGEFSWPYRSVRVDLPGLPPPTGREVPSRSLGLEPPPPGTTLVLDLG